MVKKEKSTGKRMFVLDTNVLMHDPSSIFRFQEHDIYIPMAVLEELDDHKRGTSEISRNVRQVSRFIADLMEAHQLSELDQGLPLTPPDGFVDIEGKTLGKLYFQAHPPADLIPRELTGRKADNDILTVALTLQNENQDAHVCLISKDINLRIKSAALGISTEDYFNDQVLDDMDLLYSGASELPQDFWETHSKEMDSWQEDGHTFYKVTGPLTKDWYINELLYIDNDQNFEATVVSLDGDSATIEVITDYRGSAHSVWGARARNREQNYALNLLMNPEVDFVTLLGTAGTGKTLLALAAGLQQVLEDKRYREVIVTRATVPVGEDIGFLPGTEEEKMTPWMGALMDNLEVLTKSDSGGDWGKAATNDLVSNRIKIRSLNFMRGRTFLEKFIIIDEAQNLTAKQMKTLITRAGPGTKVVCMGNVAQIDTPYITETSSGLTYAVDRFKDWAHSGHITLRRGERSRLADFASENL